MASRVKEVICRGDITGEKRSLYFDYYNAVKHELWNYLKEEDKYIKELVDSKKIKVDVKIAGTVYFEITIKTKEYYTFEELEKIGRAITDAIWKLETVIDNVEDNICKYFSCVYIDNNTLIKRFVEYDFIEAGLDINDYREAIECGVFWQFFFKPYSYYKKLLDENIMGLSIEVMDNYRYRVTTWVNDYNGLVRFVLEHYPESKITDRYIIDKAEYLACLVQDAIATWNCKVSRGKLVWRGRVAEQTA